MTNKLVTASIKLASPDWEMGFQVSGPEAPTLSRSVAAGSKSLEWVGRDGAGSKPAGARSLAAKGVERVVSCADFGCGS